MKNVLKYPGSKTRIAKWICEFIPEHDVYLEPFFGGGGVFFNKKPASVREKIVELLGDVPKIELFARENVNGWDCWGNEVDTG